MSVSKAMIWMVSKGKSRMRNWGYPTKRALIGEGERRAAVSSPRTVRAGLTCMRCLMASQGAVRRDPAKAAQGPRRREPPPRTP